MPSQFYRRCFLVVAAAALGLWLYQILAPLRTELGWAAVLAFVLYPLHEWLSGRLHGRRAQGAGNYTGERRLVAYVATSPDVRGGNGDIRLVSE